VNLAAGTVTGDPVLTGSDTLLGIEVIRGTHLADYYDATGFSDSSANAGWSGTLNEFEGVAGNDTILGNGNTRVSYAFARESVNVDLQAGIATGGASVGTDTILGGVNAARGSNFNDQLVGSAGNDTLEGLSGNDVLRGGGGNDFISGGAGSDRIDFDALSDGLDTISGFEAVLGGDVLDIADLLAWTSYAGGDVSPFVRFETVAGVAQMQIDADGAGAAAWLEIANLPGHASLDLTTLLANGNLDIVI
jgi:Ca2+-binding RTX toxin-like protein